ncbi:helix-turn-helix domain-containing protein [Perlucidibaca aquatica]|uniref:helix-turn-helix domain-containing protein n=1 Tax=Perlucidibaca aquatica TaxID=1852776 RepID=UPI00083A0C09|nr:helix-turn-helix transcriptional regulator [Perlucidibaca aquatica]
MDKRFHTMTHIQQMEARLAVYRKIEERPGLPLPEVLKLLRTGLRITRAEISRMTNLSVRYLQEIEHGQANPTMDIADQLLKPFGLRMGVVME